VLNDPTFSIANWPTDLLIPWPSHKSQFLFQLVLNGIPWIQYKLVNFFENLSELLAVLSIHNSRNIVNSTLGGLRNIKLTLNFNSEREICSQNMNFRSASLWIVNYGYFSSNW
jgi:hypothetical protein